MDEITMSHASYDNLFSILAEQRRMIEQQAAEHAKTLERVQELLRERDNLARMWQDEHTERVRLEERLKAKQIKIDDLYGLLECGS